MFRWNMYAGQIPSDVQVEHVHLTDPSNVSMEHGHLLASLKCSSGTCAPVGLSQMFKWNMHARVEDPNVLCKQVHPPTSR